MLWGGLLMLALGSVPYTPTLRSHLQMEQLQVVATVVGFGVGASGMASMGLPPSTIIAAGFVLIAAILVSLKDIASRVQADRTVQQQDICMLLEKQAAAEQGVEQWPANSSPVAAAKAVAEFAQATLNRLQ